MKHNTLALWLLVVGCADQAPTTGLPCPCSTGYVCCGDNVCVPEGDACSMRTEMPGQGPQMTTDTPCTATEDQNDDGIIDMSWTYLYDGAGRRVRGEGTSVDGMIDDVWLYTYNAIGQPTDTQHSVNGSVESEETESYDAMGRLASDTITAQGMLQQADMYSYSGLTVTVVSTLPGHGDANITVQEDSTGHPLSATMTAAGMTLGTMTFTYNADGTISSSEMDFIDGVSERQTWTYNALGLLTQLAGARGTTTSFTYDAQERQATIAFQFAAGNPLDITTNQYCN